MPIEIRQASHPDAVRAYDTEKLRAHFLVETLFSPGHVDLTYSHIDRYVVGGAVPLGEPLLLSNPKELGTKTFLERRELGIVNIGGAGRVILDGAAHELARRDALYVGMGVEEVRFESANASDPARFYLLSAPAHAAYPAVKISIATAKSMRLGAKETANERTIYQMIHPEVCRSCQLVMGMTMLDAGSVWNTMPCHTHDRRSEVYLYFDLAPEARVFHLMGAPQETRHLVVGDGQAILSPGWSIHSGCGTTNYSFIWGMAGDNQDYTDMDMVQAGELR